MPYAQPLQYRILQGQGVPDGVLVGQALTGDQSAFELMVSRYHTPFVSYIRSMLKDDGQVYDVLQHVFLKLYVSLPILLTNVSLKGVKPVYFFMHQQTLPFTGRAYHVGESKIVAPTEWGETLGVFSPFTSHPFLPGGATV